jgi:pimeloyl-ACP methyl ester carboxylesterase
MAWNAERTAGRLVEFVEIRGAGHLPMIDETEKFVEVLIGFLGTL